MENTHDLEIPIISALIAGNGRAGEILVKLRSEDFSESLNQVLFDISAKLFSCGMPVNSISVANELCRQNPGENAVTVRETLEREYRPGNIENVEYYIQALLEANLVRAYNVAGTTLQYATSVEDAEQIVQNINGLSVKNVDHISFTGCEAALDFADRLDQRLKAPSDFIKWGIEPLDNELYVQLGDFVVIGGRPSAGKTLLALQFALFMAQARRVGFISLETSKEKLTERAISHLSSVPLYKLKKPRLLDETDWAKIGAAEKLLSNLDIEIADRGNRTVQQIRALALNRRWQIVFVDYLQKLSGSGKTRYEQVTNISQELQTLAQTSGICVIALAQLSRGGGQGECDKPPTLEGFRESGQIEQDADVAMLLYLKNPADKGGNRVLKIAKHKEGQLFDCTLGFSGGSQALYYKPYTMEDCD